jgi:hypothetical protein
MTRNNAVAMAVAGSMSPARGAAKIKNSGTTRMASEKVFRTFASQQVLSQSQSPFGVGSQFTEGTLLFSVEKLSDQMQSFVQSYDKYRIREVEIFCTMNSAVRGGGNIDKTVPVHLYFYEDTDANADTETSWIRVQDRRNLGKVVLHATNPSQRLISFTPTATFNNQNVTNVNNMQMPKNFWTDSASIVQQFSGLRFFSATPAADSTGNTFQFILNFEVRYHLEVTQPL